MQDIYEDVCNFFFASSKITSGNFSATSEPPQAGQSLLTQRSITRLPVSDFIKDTFYYSVDLFRARLLNACQGLFQNTK